MRKENSVWKNIDWLTIIIYLTLAIMGWLNIYSAIYNPEINHGLFELDYQAGKQFLWICISVVTIIIILIIDFHFFLTIPYLLYGVIFLALCLVFTPLGIEIAGNRSWLNFGFMRFQPAEFGKLAVALALAKFIDSQLKFRYGFNKATLIILGIIFTFPFLILLQPDTGSAIVFACFILVLFLDGLTAVIPVIGLIFIGTFVSSLIIDNTVLLTSILGGIFFIIFLFMKKNKLNIIIFSIATLTIGIIPISTDIILHDVLRPHQRKRIEVMIDPESDPRGVGWNVIQSKTAIGSGGMWGTGFQKGTFTKGDYVPEQHTDFIFCTIGEEHGFIGSITIITLFMALLLRILFLTNRQRSRFSKVYGYSVVAILFFHFFINIGMVIGLLPVIGIPLPFFSYGGSSLWSFSMLLFIFLKLDMHRSQVLSRN